MGEQHDRVRAALELREPDRVPTMDVMEEYANIYDVLGKKPTPLGFFVTNHYASALFDHVMPLLNRIGFMDSEMDRFSHDRTEAAVKLGYDSAWVMHVPIWRFRDSRVAEDIFGHYYDVVVDDRGNIATPVYRGGLITSPADWKAWDKRAILRLPERANRVYGGIQKDFGDRIAVFASFLYGLFENTWQPLGFERFAVALRRERKFIEQVIKFYEDHYCLMIEAWADAGVPGAVYSDDMAYRSGPMLNPRLMDELYGDSFRRITETAHSHGMKIVVHTDGMVYPLLPWFADCGFDGVHSLEPTAGVELAHAKEMVGDRLCLCGNLDITHILVDASREEVFAAVRDSIRAAGAGGGYIVAPTNSHPSIDMQRLRWMLQAVEEHGRYPLSGD
ncbi:MAG: uroporphyrinogen decarboxylase family protein [Actinomycetota bacterium]